MDKLAYFATIFIVFCMSTCNGQTFATNETFKDNIAKDITVIEFWAGWNSINEFKELIKLKECIVYRIDITSNLEIQMEYNVSAIPTIIIFESGKEKERFNPNVMFQLEADKKTIQYTIDTLILNKFQ